MKRRTFLKLACASAVIASGNFYFNDEKMRKAQRTLDGKIIADLHAHPANYKDDQSTLEMLSEQGVQGLTFIRYNNKILTYEDVIKKFANYITEIDKNMFAKVIYKDRTGYIVRTQELVGSPHHILAIGFEGGYFPVYKDPRKAIEEIHKRKGLAILNHPFITPNGGAKIVRYRFINDDEEKMVNELCEMVDEVEIFNAQCINPTYGLVVPNMKKANLKAEQFALKHNFKGTVASDAHKIFEQTKVCGIYVDEEKLCMDKLKHDIKHGNFDNNYRHYVSKWSFVKGMFIG